MALNTLLLSMKSKGCLGIGDDARIFFVDLATRRVQSRIDSILYCSSGVALEAADDVPQACGQDEHFPVGVRPS